MTKWKSIIQGASTRAASLHGNDEGVAPPLLETRMADSDTVRMASFGVENSSYSLRKYEDYTPVYYANLLIK